MVDSAILVGYATCMLQQGFGPSSFLSKMVYLFQLIKWRSQKTLVLMFVLTRISYLISVHFSLPSAQLNTFLLIKMCYSVTKLLNTFKRTYLQKFLYIHTHTQMCVISLIHSFLNSTCSFTLNIRRFLKEKKICVTV